MAIIGEIRKRPVLVLALVGLALASFVLTDLFTNLFRGGEEAQQAVTIEGEPLNEIQRQFLANMESYFIYQAENQAQQNGQASISLTENLAAKNRAWNQFSLIAMVDQQNEHIGIETPDAELETLFYKGDSSAQIHDWVEFAMPFINNWPIRDNDNANFVQYSFEYGKKMMSNEHAAYQVSQFRMYEKYLTMLQSGFYATSVEARRNFENTSNTKNIRFAYKGFASMPDSMYLPTDDEIKAYYKAHNNDPEYRQKPGKLIEYAIINMKPSEEDRKVALNSIKTLSRSFGKATNNLRYIQTHSDDYTEDKTVIYQLDSVTPLPEQYDSLIRIEDSIGVFGPYEENGYFKIIKVQPHYKRRARHILFKEDGKYKDNLNAVIDSVYRAVAENDSTFPMLAAQYSEGPSGTSGGDLGFFDYKTMVPPFANFCFSSKIDDIGVVKSQFGYHIVQVTDELTDSAEAQFKTVSILEKRIKPLHNTIRNYEDEAKTFISDAYDSGDFAKTAKEKGYKVDEVQVFEPSNFVPGFQNEQKVYAFYEDGTVDDYTEPMPIGDMMYVFRIKKVYKKGPQAEDEAWEAMKAELIKEKKARALKTQIATTSGVEGAATAWEVTVQSDDVAFADFRIDGVNGNEAYVIGAIFGDYADGSLIPEPLVGENGVFVVQVVSTKNTEPGDLTVNQNTLRSQYESMAIGRNAETGLFRALKEYVKVKDKR